MRSNLQFLRVIYGKLLMLYPKIYREEYGEELQVVFGLSVEEATKMGGSEVERLILRELVSLPKAVVLEYL